MLLTLAVFVLLYCDDANAFAALNLEPRTSTLIRAEGSSRDKRTLMRGEAELMADDKQPDHADLDEVAEMDLSSFTGHGSSGQGYRVSPIGLVSHEGQIQFPYMNLGAGHSQAVLKVSGGNSKANLKVYRDDTCGEVQVHPHKHHKYQNHTNAVAAASVKKTLDDHDVRPSVSMCTWKWDGKRLMLQDPKVCEGSGEYSCCLTWKQETGGRHAINSSSCAAGCRGNQCRWCMVSLSDTIRHIMPMSGPTCAMTLASCLPSSTCMCLSGGSEGDVRISTFSDSSVDCRTRWHGIDPVA